jgi:endonuclease YncB( thermonuclease family)
MEHKQKKISTSSKTSSTSPSASSTISHTASEISSATSTTSLTGPKPEYDILDDLLAYPAIAMPVAQMPAQLTPAQLAPAQLKPAQLAPAQLTHAQVAQQVKILCDKKSAADPELEQQIWGADFSYKDLVCEAKVVDVYDGDTIRVTFLHNGEFQQWKSRMMGYDSPEMKPRKDNPNRYAEKRAALAAKQALETKIGNQVVIIHCGTLDKYGRLLITVFTKEGENVNEWMLKAGHGYAYGGGTKHSPFEATKTTPK